MMTSTNYQIFFFYKKFKILLIIPNFEKELWDAANELRGAVAENQYKDFVLSLIFLKHLSERYELRKQELLHLVKSLKSEYYSTNLEEIE